LYKQWVKKGKITRQGWAQTRWSNQACIQL
jgi:hypothetical protein